MRDMLLFLLVFIIFFSACGSEKAPNAEKPVEKVEEKKTPIDENALIMRLSNGLAAEPETQAEIDQNLIVNYAIDNLLEVKRTRSGLYYQILEEGEGQPIKWADQVVVHYKGYFLDGRVFDSSYEKDKPLTFYVGNMIPAWNEGLQLLKKKSKALFLVPSELAYGPQGFQNSRGQDIVPPNTVLAFELEVLQRYDK